MSRLDQNPARFVLHAVGVVKSDIKQPGIPAGSGGLKTSDRMEMARKTHQKIKSLVSTVEIFSEYNGILDGIEDFSHIMILYWPHLNPQERRKLRRVHPMGREDLPEKGIFATCSPARPNPVLVSTVRLLSREGFHMRVKGLEAVDESPVLDIKPFVHMAHGADHPSVPEWMRHIHEQLEAGPPPEP